MLYRLQQGFPYSRNYRHGIMVFCNQHKDIIDIDFYLLYQFQLKDNIIHNTVFVTGFWLDFLIYVMISTRIILAPCTGDTALERFEFPISTIESELSSAEEDLVQDHPELLAMIKER